MMSYRVPPSPVSASPSLNDASPSVRSVHSSPAFVQSWDVLKSKTRSKAASPTRQVRLLLSNLAVQKIRSWRTSLSEFLLPLVFFIAFNSPGLPVAPRQVGEPGIRTFAPRALGTPSLFVGSPVFPPSGPYSGLYIPQEWPEGVSLMSGGTGPELLWAPNTSAAVRAVMGNLTANSAGDFALPLRARGFAHDADATAYYEAHPMSVWASVVFENEFSYSIRINGSWAPSTKPEQQRRVLGGLTGASGGEWERYIQTGFSLLQYCVDQAILHVATEGAWRYRAPLSSVPGFNPLQCLPGRGEEGDGARLGCNVSAALAFERLPQEMDYTDEQLWILKWLPGWCLNIAVVFWLSSCMMPLVAERGKKTPMRVMGLVEASYQAAHFLYAAVLSMPLACCFAAIWKVVNFTRFSSFWLVAMYLYVYLLVIFAFAYAVAPAVRNSDRVSMLNFLIVFVAAFSYVTVLIATGEQDGRGLGGLKLSLAFTCPFFSGHLASELIAQLENLNLGLNSQTFTLEGTGDEPTFASLMWVSLGSLVFWILAAPFTEAAASDDDTALQRLICSPWKHFCSCCWPSRYRFNNFGMGENDSTAGELRDVLLTHDGLEAGLTPDPTSPSRDFHEAIPTEHKGSVCVRVNALTKVFEAPLLARVSESCAHDPPSSRDGGSVGSERRSQSSRRVVAVNKLSMELCVGQIFSLLGHNGAGKTTTISMLTNSVRPTAGDATFYLGGSHRAMRLSDDRSHRSIAASMGMCPQHNILWNECTPREHLALFARLKGVEHSNVDFAVQRLLEQISLPPGDEDRPVGTLSGGNMRKTSLGIALTGDPLCVFLDEPTAGMDPASRRKCWEMLQRIKRGRAIVLCTHFMDEADILGDRIGIMVAGKLVASGTSLFLKHKFGRGYTITAVTPAANAATTTAPAISKATAAETEVTGSVPEHPRSESLLGLLQRVVPETALVSTAATETKLSVPLAKVDRFPELIHALEAAKLDSVITSFTLKLSTLEDVFLEVARRWHTTREAGQDGFSDIEQTTAEVNAPASPGFSATLADDDDGDKGSGYVPFADNQQGRRMALSSTLALCNARFKTLIRSPNAAILSVALPFFMVVLGFVSVTFLSSESLVRPEPLALTPSILEMPDPDGGSVPPCTWDLANASEPYAAQLSVPTTDDALDVLSALGGTVRRWDDVASVNKAMSVASNPDAPSNAYSRRSCGGIALGSDGGGGGGNKSSGSVAILEKVFSKSLGWTATLDKKQGVLLLVNSSEVASLPVALNAYSNAVLASFNRHQNQSQTPPYSIRVANHPLPYKMPEVVDTSRLFLPMFVGVGFLSVGLGCIALVGDRETKRRHVLRLSVFESHTLIDSLISCTTISDRGLTDARVRLGVPASVYVAGNLMFDLLAIGAPLAVTGTLLIYVVQAHWFQGVRLAGWLALVATGPASAALFAYACSHAFTKKDDAARLWPMILPASTIMPFVLVYVLKVPGASESNIQTADALSRAFTIIPAYSFQDGLQRLMLLDDYDLQNGGGNSGAIPGVPDLPTIGDAAPLTLGIVFSYDHGIGLNTGMNCAWIFIGWVLVTWLESGGADRKNTDANAQTSAAVSLAYDDDDLAANFKSPLARSASCDSDVAREEIVSASIAREATGLGNQLASFSGLATRMLCKDYADVSSGSSWIADATSLCNKDGNVALQKKSKRAVRELSMVVPRGELFVLLGPNGAGKSTTMSVLTTEVAPTSGAASVGGFDVVRDRTVLRGASVMGYCPQFDPLYEQLTVEEHLRLFCALQGVHGDAKVTALFVLVDEAVASLDLVPHRSKRARALSGGNKRKLSIALALVGNPQCVLLDEPSTGVDVAARRVIWRRFRAIRRHACVLLSTHAMEEAVALHDRIGVMVRGQLRAVGSASHLQAKFGSGFTLDVSAENGSGDAVHQYVAKNFRSAVLKERFGGQFKFNVHGINGLARIFEVMNSPSATSAGVQFFAVAHTSLEDIFLALVREANEKEEEFGWLSPRSNQMMQ